MGVPLAVAVILLIPIGVSALYILWRILTSSNRDTMLTLARHMPDPVLITNKKGKIIAYSPSACELFGYKPDEIINLAVEALMPKEIAEKHHKLRDDFMQSRSGKAMDNEITCVSKIGEKITAVTRVRTFSIDNENYAFISIQDVRKYKHREERLKNLSESDPLTGLANRRLFDHDLQREWDRASRNSQPLTVMMIDVDFFKQYNDCYGHPAGDSSLIRIAEVMREVIHRSTDCIARYGGEEFICLLPLLGEKDAIKKAEALRHIVEAAKIPHKQSSISNYITISIGLATVVPNANQDLSILIDSADSALYRAKADGRNCVRTAT